MAINNIYEWEGDDTQPFGNNYWRSKEVVTPGRVRLSCARVLFTPGDLEPFYQTVLDREEIIDSNAAKLATGQLGTTGGIEGGYIHANYPIAGDNLEAVPAAPVYGGDLTIEFRLYADGVLKFTKTLYTSRVFKLPGGYRGTKWMIVLTGNVEKVQRCDVASSVQELMKLQQK